MDIVKIQKSLLIDDTYNANPQSMKSALDVLAHYRKRGPIVAVLGDMLEMGPSAAAYHEEVGVYAADAGVDHLYVYGPTSMHYAVGARSRHMDPARIRHFQSRGDLVDALVPLIEQGAVLLVKGSRGMEMDRIVKVIKEKFE
jgi:UDP-N-acetylmuramoyl-tripeptide--D-alanyl-D-alanine ligase